MVDENQNQGADKPFQTPDEIAASDSHTSEEHQPNQPEPANNFKPPQGEKPHKFKHWWHSLSKKKKVLLIIIAAILVLAISGGIVYGLTRHKAPTPKPAPAKATTKPKSIQLTSNLTGLPISDASINQRPVTGVMIENSLEARPQSGLNQAGVVFEAIAEAGITRFLALYQDTQPDYIGPVRSARPYFLQWCLGFDCALAHVGGSPEALSDIKTWGVKDLNQFYNGGSYERISSRAAPHNVYTSMAQLSALEGSKGIGASKYTSFPRKPDSPSKTPNATSVDISPSSSNYSDHYDYDQATNSYKRSEGGQPHMELNKNGTQVQIQPKVVIAMVMQYSLESDGYHSQYNVIGSGPTYVFQDGTVTTGTWQKTSNAGQVTFTDANGQPIKLDAGQTWITAVGSASDVSYK